MVVCGDDALAPRLAVELSTVCAEHVTSVVPSGSGGGNHGRIGPTAMRHGTLAVLTTVRTLSADTADTNRQVAP